MTKKLSILTGLFLCIGLFGQTEFRPSLGLGFHGGMNLSTVDFIPSIKQSNVIGYSGGFVINYTAERSVGLQLELNYSQRGWTDENDSLGQYTRNMTFYEIPFLTHVYFGKRLVRVNFDLGPYVAFHQEYTEEYEASRIPNELLEPDTIILGYRTYYGEPIESNFDYGFLVGGGIGFNTKAGEFQLMFRYSQGLSNVFKKYPEGNFRFSQMESVHFGFAWIYPIYFSPKD